MKRVELRSLILATHSRPAMTVGVQQPGVGDVLQMAVLSLQLSPEELGVIRVPVMVPGIERLLRSSRGLFSVSDPAELAAAVQKARRGGDLVVLCCAWRVGPVGLGAGDHLIRLVTVVPCEKTRESSKLLSPCSLKKGASSPNELPVGDHSGEIRGWKEVKDCAGEHMGDLVPVRRSSSSTSTMIASSSRLLVVCFL